jgi:malate permease and related proteins
MMALVPHLLGVVGPVFLCAAVGFVLTRAGQPFDPKVTTPIIMNVAMPALIVAHLSEQHVSIGGFSTMMLAALIAVTLFGLAAMVLLRLCGLSFRTYLGGFMFANVGNIGLPSVTLAFGAGGLAVAFGFWIVVVVGLLTVGTWLPQRRLSFRKLVSSPLIYAILIGLGLLASGTRLPDMLHAPLAILGGAAIPLMLLSLGHALAELKPGSLARGFVLAVAHIAIVAPVAALTVAILDLEGLVRSVFIVEALMPVSVFAYLFAQQYHPDDAPALASLILFSTLLTVVVLPLALAYWI